MGLTVKKLEALNEPGRYADGQGLYLQVAPTGGRFWLLRYERADHRPGRKGKRRERWMGLGSANDFTLDEARERARKARQQLRDGIDPIDHRKAERRERATQAALAEAKDVTFADCAELF